MNFFVTGVGGQLGHDVMNELLKRGHEGVGSDIQETYSGVADGSAVTKAPYVALDITDKEAVEKVITEVNPDAVIHCAAWTAVDMAEDDDKVAKARAINAGGTQNIADPGKKPAHPFQSSPFWPSTYHSMALATPSSSLQAVRTSAAAAISGAALPMATPSPAARSMARSLMESPQAIT